MQSTEKSKIGDGGFFGSWNIDDGNLPVFDCAAMESFGGEDAEQNDLWHQVANDRYTAEAHHGGWFTVYRWERGLVMLTPHEPTDWEKMGGVGAIVESGKTQPLLKHLMLDDCSWSVRWGVGYAQWKIESERYKIVRTIEAPFGDDPLLSITVEIENKGSQIIYEDRWPIMPYTLTLPLPMTKYGPAPEGIMGKDRIAWRVITAVGGTIRKVGNLPRSYYSRLLKWQIENSGNAVIASPTYNISATAPIDGKKSWLENSPRPIFLASCDVNSQIAGEKIAGGIILKSETKIEKNEKKTLRLLFGWAQKNDIQALIEKHKSKNKKSWTPSLPKLSVSESSSLTREIPWHGHYLRSMMVKDDYFENHIIPQGSAYSYLHGAHGALRDYVLCIVPLIYLAPKRAREFILACARLTMSSGEMLYSHVAFGQATGAGGIHSAPTDLSLFFLWAVLEYVAATKDKGILDEVIPFYPKESGNASSLRERISTAWKYMRDDVGVGPHDLLRAGTGDWNDPISYTVPDPKTFHRRGESCYNTAMALWVLPKTAMLVETWSASEAAEIRMFVARLESAMKHAWTGEWFLRGWDGKNNPIGEDRIFLDSSVWCLIAGVGGEDKTRRLLNNIKERLDDPSPIGANILDKPVKMKYGILAPGWDCNGGVWAALNGLLCWGYSLYDPELAWRSLNKQSLAAHAKAYPHIWYGIWSGPDSYNAHWASDPGHTFIHPLTPMREYPVMNSNAHALPLLALIKLAGAEPYGAELKINPKMPKRLEPWKVDYPLLEVSMQNGKRDYKIKQECFEEA